MAIFWNLWHGCTKISEGCANCYMYADDKKYGRDSQTVKKTQNFHLPIKKSRNKTYKVPSGEVLYTCFTSDFFIDEADEWRDEAWAMIRQRPDLQFFMTTKRVERIGAHLPSDWALFDNVTICCTVENQKQADIRLPIYLNLPLKNKTLICEPLLSAIDLSVYLHGLDKVIVGGESGDRARACDFGWILAIRTACIHAGVDFEFHQTGANFIKEGRHYTIPRHLHHLQAKKAGIDVKFVSSD
ncbi:DUF5131 family protein [Moraxella sp. ZY210820]|uniref:DUF5131 family protein n=1 Tax=unclassified Moraxella TaxID=2685852 RepID=UPI00272FB8AB|nr:DUF5131 family protein [Moraxella sp. ZY210820]WLF83351.1 phage Gp37/Gp68 family protein [Moraxella sp. ZY210820]